MGGLCIHSRGGQQTSCALCSQLSVHPRTFSAQRSSSTSMLCMLNRGAMPGKIYDLASYGWTAAIEAYDLASYGGTAAVEAELISISMQAHASLPAAAAALKQPLQCCSSLV